MGVFVSFCLLISLLLLLIFCAGSVGSFLMTKAKGSFCSGSKQGLLREFWGNPEGIPREFSIEFGGNPEGILREFSIGPAVC